MAYQWQYNDQNIAETTANTLAIRGIKTNQAENYRVKVTNSAGEAISAEAVVGVQAKQQSAIMIHSPKMNGANLEFSFDSTPGNSYQVETSASMAPNTWINVFNGTASATSMQFSVTATDGISHFFRVREN
jgi:hypothetical protein